MVYIQGNNELTQTLTVAEQSGYWAITFSPQRPGGLQRKPKPNAHVHACACVTGLGAKEPSTSTQTFLNIITGTTVHHQIETGFLIVHLPCLTHASRRTVILY